MNILFTYEKGGKSEIDLPNVLKDEELEEALTKQGKTSILPRPNYTTTRFNVVNHLLICPG